MFCSKCGKKVEEGSLFCSSCGARVSSDAASAQNTCLTQETDSMKASQVTPPEGIGEINPMQNFEPEPSAEAMRRTELVRKAESVQNAAAPSWEDTAAENFASGCEKAKTANSGLAGAEQIIGKNADYYMEQFTKFRQGEKSKMNWAALFLGVFHASYRNVWQKWLKVIWMPLAAELAAVLAGAGLMFSSPIWGTIAMAASGIAGIWLLVVQILYAKRFNHTYMQHVDKKLSGKDLQPDISVKRVVITGVAVVAVMVVENVLVSAVSAAVLEKTISAWASDFDDDWLSDFDEDDWSLDINEENDDLGQGENLNLSGSDSGDALYQDGGSDIAGGKDWPDEYDQYYFEGVGYLDVIQDAMQSYMSCEYALYDMDRDGIEELIVSYGDSNADYSNAVWTLAGDGVMYVGGFYLPVVLYEAEDGNGIYAVYGYQSYQVVNRITKEGYDIYSEPIMEGEIGETDYYMNDNPIPWYYTSGIMWNEIRYFAGRWSSGDTELSISIYSSAEYYEVFEETGSIEIAGDYGQIYYLGMGDAEATFLCIMPAGSIELVFKSDGTIVAENDVREYGIRAGQVYFCTERYES